MPSVPTVSPGEWLDKVIAVPAHRDSAPGKESFADTLAGASQELSASAQAAGAPSQPAKGREPQNDATPPKGQGPDPAKKETASSTDSSNQDEKPAPAAEGKTEAPRKGQEEEPSSDAPGGDDVKGLEKAALVLTQLIQAGVYGLFKLTGGAPVEAGEGEGLKLGATAPAPAPVAAPGQEAVQAVVEEGVALLPQGGAPEQDVQAGAQALVPQADPEAELPAFGPVLADEAEPAALPARPAEAAPEAAPAAPEDEVLVLPVDKEVLRAEVPTDDAPVADEIAPVPVAWEEAAEPAATLPSDAEVEVRAPVQPAASTEEAGADEVRIDDIWIRWRDDAASLGGEKSSKAAGPVLFPGSGDFGQPLDGDDPKGHLIAARHAEAPGAGGSDKPAPAQPMDAFLRAEVHRQVVEAALSRMSVALRDGMAQARLLLEPPSLGRLHMDLRMQDGAMNAKVTVETTWARDAVMSGLRELRESLQRQGVALERFSVDVQAGLNAGNFSQDRTGQGGDGALYLEAVPEDDLSAPAAGRGPAYAAPLHPADGSINIFA